MRAQGDGSAVTLSTVGACESSSRYPISSIPRAAVASYSKILSDQYAGAGVRVNSVLADGALLGYVLLVLENDGTPVDFHRQDLMPRSLPTTPSDSSTSAAPSPALKRESTSPLESPSRSVFPH